MTIATLFLLGFVLWTIISQRSSLKGFTAQSAWAWAVAGGLGAAIAIGLRLLPGLPAGIVTSVHYLAATLMLAPLVDILGARNPGHKAWPWFVIIPMLLVLQWPTVSHLASERLEIPLTVPLPAMIGFLLVLIMGTGNYFGTGNTTACLFSAAAILTFALPVTEWSSWPGNTWCLASAIAMTLAALLIEGRLKSSHGNIGHQCLWIDFRDIYGMVWARRVMDRLNQFAGREKWPVAMTLDGFRSSATSLPPTEDIQRAEEVLRWVLRRFADEEQLSRYLADNSTDDTTSDEEESPMTGPGSS